MANAHVRQPTSTRQSPDVQAEEAQRLLNDPAFQRAFDAVHNSMVTAIINNRHENAEQADEFERECCRTLRNLHAIKRTISVSVQEQQLRAVNARKSGL